MNATVHTPFAPIDLMSGPKQFADIPADRLAVMGVKLYIVGALAWDYTDSVLNIAAQMRIPQTKRLCRTIRSLRCNYDKMRALSLDREHMRCEWNLAEMFEGICKSHFQKLCLGLRNEIRRDTELNPQYVMLVEAVQMAMTLIDTLRLYAAECDSFIRNYYPTAPHSILPDHFKSLATLLPEFAGDCYDASSYSRSTTARILLKEINDIELYG